MANPKFWSNSTAISGGVATVAAPTLVTEGLDITRLEGCRIILSTDSGQTLSLTGSSEAIRIWLWSSSLGRWCRNYRLEITLSTSDAGARDAVFEDVAIFAPIGRIFAGPANVTASGGNGTNIITTIEAW